MSTTIATRITFPEKLRKAFIQAYHGKCQYCGGDGANVIEHIVPLAKDGTNDLENLTLACTRCNGKKAALLLPEVYAGILIAQATQKAPKIREAMRPKKKDRPSPVQVGAERSWPMMKLRISENKYEFIRNIHGVVGDSETFIVNRTSRIIVVAKPHVWNRHGINDDDLYNAYRIKCHRGSYTAQGWRTKDTDTELLVDLLSFERHSNPPSRYRKVEIKPSLMWLLNTLSLDDYLEALAHEAVLDVRRCIAVGLPVGAAPSVFEILSKNPLDADPESS